APTAPLAPLSPASTSELSDIGELPSDFLDLPSTAHVTSAGDSLEAAWVDLPEDSDDDTSDASFVSKESPVGPQEPEPGRSIADRTLEWWKSRKTHPRR